MGKFTKGINGGFFGKTDSVVGSKWKGINYMRGLPDPVKRKASPLQAAQQERFRFVSRFLQGIQPFFYQRIINIFESRQIGSEWKRISQIPLRKSKYLSLKNELASSLNTS
jgi:hypothetical protein